MQTKSIFKSKTLWVNLLVLVGTLLPPVQHFLLTLPGTETAAEYVAGILAFTNLILRLITNGPVALSGK